MARPLPTDPSPGPAREAPARLVPLDRLRGLVMVLMAVDHASGVFNAGRLVTDGPTLYQPGSALPAAQFLTRWISHLCAPTFVFLAGTALALSVARRQTRGESERALDRFIITRGLFIAALDPLWMSWVFLPGRVLLQVLYAIGFGMVAMAVLRRLSDRTLVIIAVSLVVAGEALTGAALLASGNRPGPLVALLLTGGELGPVIVAYPLLPWLAIMLLGWSFGRWLPRASSRHAGDFLALGGVAALVLFVAVRGANAYGNMRLVRDDWSLVQWLHVSKYPPSLAYTSLELGLMGVLLAAFLAVPERAGLLALLGQTALFFYLLHVHVLVLVAGALGLAHGAGLLAAWLGGLAVVVALYPLCARYRGYKRTHPDGLARYV